MIAENINKILEELPSGVKLVAVSKFHPAENIMQAYNAGQRLFGESRAQEFIEKVKVLPNDIKWHFIGHLQTNKLKLVLPYVELVHSVDSLRLLENIDNWGKANNRITNVLLELRVAKEVTKQGLSQDEILDILKHSSDFGNICFMGLMGMATNTDDIDVIKGEFNTIASFKSKIKLEFPNLTNFNELSLGMSGDYKLALEYGTTIVRIGTAIFGSRNY